MKKSFFFFTFIILCILFSSMYYIKSQLSIDLPEATLVKSFESSGAKVVNSEIYFWSRIDNSYGSFGDLKHMVESIMDKLGVVKDSSYVINTVNTDLMGKIEANGISEKKQAVSVSIRIDKKDKETAENTLSGTITQDLSSDWLEEASKNITAILKSYRIDPQLNTCIVGNYEGLLNDDRLNDIARDILESAEAKKIEGMRDNRLISVSAYSPNILDSIKVNGKKVNLNLAIRYNAYENKTYIWLATPVITKEY